MTKREKFKRVKKIKRKIKFALFIFLNLSTFFITAYLFKFIGGWGLLYLPAYMIGILYYLETYGYMRRIRTPEQIQFFKDHEYHHTEGGDYYGDTIKYYKNKVTGEIVPSPC